MRTFGELKSEVLRYFDVADEPAGSADVVLVESALNQANQRRVSEDDWTFMLSRQCVLEVERGVQEYVIPRSDFHKLQYLYSTTKDRFAEQINVRQAPYEELFDNTSDPTYNFEVIQDGSPVIQQPSYNDKIDVASTLSESAGVQLYLEGEDEDGLPVSETVDAGDTTIYHYSRITYYAKLGTWTGTLTLTTEGGDVLLTLTPSESAKSFAVVRFLAPPVSDESFTYRYFRRPRVMTRDHDRPDVPFPVSNVLVYDALLDLATYNELDSESVSIWRKKQEEWELNLYTLKLDAASVGGAPWQINEGRRQ